MRRLLPDPLPLESAGEWEPMIDARMVLLGFCVYLSPKRFDMLAARWFPGEFTGEAKLGHSRSARIIRVRFWKAAATTTGVVGAILVAVLFLRGSVTMSAGDWVRVTAAVTALTAALGRGGWPIQTWKSTTVVERSTGECTLLANLAPRRCWS